MMIGTSTFAYVDDAGIMGQFNYDNSMTALYNFYYGFVSLVDWRFDTLQNARPDTVDSLYFKVLLSYIYLFKKL